MLSLVNLPHPGRVETIGSLAQRLGVQERIIVKWDLPKDRPVARTPNPSVRTFIAAETTIEGVLSLAIGVCVRSLNRLLHAWHKYHCWRLWSRIFTLPFFTVCSLWQWGHLIS